MPTLEELFPELYGTPQQTLQQNKPGLGTAFKHGLAGYPIGAGRALEDMGLEAPGGAIRQYGERVQQRNPLGVQNFEQFAESPWLGTKEAIGSALGSTLPSLVPYFGLGTRGAMAAGGAISSVPSYGDIRQIQDQTGEVDLLKAAGGALATGAIEQLGGVQSLFRPSPRVLGNVTRAELGQMASTPLRTAGMQALRVGAGEGAEELAQGPIEQWAGGQNPGDHIHETLFGGFQGLVGGGLTFGLGSGIRRGMQQASIRPEAQSLLTNPMASFQDQLGAAQVEQHFTGQDYVPGLLRDRISQGMTTAPGMNELDLRAMDQLGVDNGEMFDPQTINPYDVGGQVTAYQQGAEMDLGTEQQYGLFGGGGAQPFTPPISAQESGFAPLTPGQPMIGLPHQGQVLPPNVPVEEQVSRAASITAAAARGANVLPTDREWADQVLKQNLTPVQYQGFISSLVQKASQRRQAQSGQQALPTEPAAAAPAGNQYVDAYKKAGGLYSPSQKALAGAKTDEEALGIIRDVLENKTPSQKVMKALEEMHKQLSGKTMTQWMQERDATDPRKPGPVTITKGDANVVRETPLQGTPAQTPGAGPSTPVQGKATPESERTQEQARQEQSQVAEPQEPQMALLQKMAARNPRLAKVLSLYTGWGEPQALDSYEAIGERLNPKAPLSRQRVEQLKKQAFQLADQIVAEEGIQLENFRPKETNETTRPDEKLGAPPEAPKSSLSGAADAAAAGIVAPLATDESAPRAAERNTGFSTRPISELNSDNIVGEAVVREDGKLGEVKATGDAEANVRAKVVEQAIQKGDTDLLATQVWDAAAQSYPGMKSWADTKPETKAAWLQFYKEKSEVPDQKRRDAGLLRRIREFIKSGDYQHISYPDLSAKWGDLEAADVRANPYGMRAWAHRFSLGDGEYLSARIAEVYVADNLPGDAVVAKFDNNEMDAPEHVRGKYVFLVRRQIWEMRDDRYAPLIERLFHHEFEHIVDNSSMQVVGTYSADSTLAPGGLVFDEVDSLWITDKALFAYPMDTKKYPLKAVQQKELFAQIMSAYHTPALRERLKRFPLAYEFARITDEEIRAEMAARPSGAPASRSEEAGAAGAQWGRGSLDSGNDGIGQRELFKPQLHEGFARQIDEVARAAAQGGQVRREAAGKLVLIGRTPVVLRAITQVDGSKPFRKSEGVVGTGATVYLKAVDDHQASSHGFKVPVETLKRLPELLADPIAVFRSSEDSSDPDSYKVVLDAEVDGKPVIVALRPNQPQRELRGEEAHFTATIFPLANGWSQVQTWTDVGLLRYYDDKRSPGGQSGTNPQGRAGGERGTKPDYSVGVSKAPVKVVTKSQLEQTPQALWSQGLEDAIAGYPEELKPSANMIRAAVQDTVKNWAKKGLQGVVFTQDLVDIAVKEGLRTAKGFAELLNSKAAKRTHLEAEIDRIMTSAADVSDRVAVNKFLQTSTRDQKWGYQPTWRGSVEVDPALAQQYERLSDEGKRVVDEVFKFGERNHAEVQRLVNKEINDEFDALLQKAGTQDERDKVESDRKKTLRVFGRTMPKLQGPYAPLKRFGDYVSVAKSQAYLDAEAAGESLTELQQDDRHYVVEFHDSFAEAKARARQLAPYFAKAEGFEKQKIYRDVQELPWGAIAKVKNTIAEMPDDTKHKSALSRLVTDLYLTMLSEGSARKVELHRRGVHGENRDMLRSFASQGRATAHFIAALEKNGEIQKQITRMQAEASNTTGDRADKSRVFNEILARYAQGLDYRPSPFTDKAMAFTSFWMLVTSPAYYLQNATQPFMLTLPVLSGRFGNGAAWASLTKAYKDVGRFIRQMGHTLDIDKLPISDDEKAMLKELRDTGRIDITIAQDLGRWTRGEGILDKGVVGKVMAKVWAAPQQVEMVNRITSALAAYRLSKGSTEYAARIVDQTHGNYAASNAPRFMNAGPAMRLITQFRKFQLIQVSLLGRLLHDSFKGASPQERAVARAALGWVLTHHLVAAGALGLPAANMAGWILAAAFGDDDEPKDFEKMAREAIGDKDLADLILKGVPAGLGLDVSGRIGMGNAFALLPFTDIKLTDRKGLAETVLGAGGPMLGGLAPKLADGAGYISKGDYLKGWASILPRGLGDAVKAYNLATDGLTQKNNDVVMKPSEFSMFDVMSQAVGLPSLTLTDRGRRVRDTIQTEQYYKDRTGEMKHKYAAAYRENDVEEMRDLREEWQSVAAAMRRQGLKPQPLSTLLKAPAEQKKREREVVDGIATKKSNREYVRRQAEL